MTELQWLIKMLTTHKLSSNLKDMFIERIGEVESVLSKQNIFTPPRAIAPSAQVASTQRILDEMSLIPMNATPMIKAPPAVVDKETGRAIVQTGKGTSGPRKF